VAYKLERGGPLAAQVNKSEEPAEHVITFCPELYHYTDTSGLKGIVESNSLWATYFGDLNDAQEVHALRVPIVDELQNEDSLEIITLKPSVVTAIRSYAFSDEVLAPMRIGNTNSG
jgi:hypothetical protein